MKHLPISGKFGYIKVLVDDSDYEGLLQYTWWVAEKSTNYKVVYTQIKRKTIILARMLLSPESGKLVDHIDRNPLNNQRSNLRIVGYRENSINTGIKKSNKSGVIGVDRVKATGRWRATIRINGIKKSLGEYESIEEAKEVRCNAEKLYYGEYCPIYEDPMNPKESKDG